MASWLWGAQSHGGQPAAVLREPTGHWGHWEPPGQVMVTNLSVSCQRGWGVGGGVPNLLLVFPEHPHLDPLLSAPGGLQPGQ